MKVIMLCFTFLVSQYLLAQANDPYRIVFEPYIGIPTFEIVGLDLRYQRDYNLPETIDPNKRISQTPHIGFRTEYRLDGIIGLGVDFRYFEANYTALYEGQDGQLYTLHMRKIKTGIMPTLNLHFLSDNEIMDFYFMIGAGYREKRIIETSNEPNFNKNKLMNTEDYIPLSARVAFGFRAYILPKIALHMNFGVGQGGIINGGVLFQW